MAGAERTGAVKDENILLKHHSAQKDDPSRSADRSSVRKTGAESAGTFGNDGTGGADGQT